MFNCEIEVPNHDQFELLKKLQLENEKLEEDSKAPPPSSLKKFHSRQGSTSSLLSVNSVASSGSSLYYNCSQEVSPSFPTMSLQGLKPKSNTSSSPALTENWDNWLSLISEWELALKQRQVSQKLSKFHQKATELFRLSWCIPEELRGLVWQLVSGAREENAACVILNPSAAVSGSSCLGPSSLLSTEHLLCLLPDQLKEVDSASSKKGNTSEAMPSSHHGNDKDDFEATKKLAFSTSTQPEALMEQNVNVSCVKDNESAIKESREYNVLQPNSDMFCPSSPVRYADLLLLPSPHEKTISRDISRTYPNHSKFKDSWGEGQESLFNVARAYSVYDKEVGYCQGSSFIIGLLLMHMPEEDAFGVLVRIMYAYNLRDLFKPSMEALGLKMYQLERLIQDNLPDLHSVFLAHGIQTSMFASPWFLTIFATVLPLPLVHRVFDAFLCQGSDVIFMLGLALLKINQNYLLGLCMEEMVQFLQKDLGTRAEADHQLFFSAAFQFKVNTKKMKKLEKEYGDIESHEKSRQSEVCQLRCENRRLQTLVEKLEKETSLLADQLMSRQIQCAELLEETSALRHAVASARKLLMDHDVLGHNIPKDAKIDLAETKELLEDANLDLNNGLALVEIESLREELIGCKLREAESNLSIKKLQHEIHEIEKLWNKTKQMSSDQDMNSPVLNTDNATTCASQCSVQELKQSLLTCHIRKANLLSELADTRLNLASLEHKMSSLEKRNIMLEKQLARSNLEIGSLIKENQGLSDLLVKNEKESLLETKKDIIINGDS